MVNWLIIHLISSILRQWFNVRISLFPIFGSLFLTRVFAQLFFIIFFVLCLWFASYLTRPWLGSHFSLLVTSWYSGSSISALDLTRLHQAAKSDALDLTFESSQTVFGYFEFPFLLYYATSVFVSAHSGSCFCGDSRYSVVANRFLNTFLALPFSTVLANCNYNFG